MRKVGGKRGYVHCGQWEARARARGAPVSQSVDDPTDGSHTLTLVDHVEPEMRTLVVTDDPLYGEGVKRLLEETGEARVFRVDSIERAQGLLG